MSIDNTQDMIDVRDIIDAVERRESDESTPLTVLLTDLADNGGDVQWEGAWYPATLIRYDYFQQYVRDYADDMGLLAAAWPNTCIDWECAAYAFQQDYSSTEYDGVTYWYC